jgi:hypothetical protein
VVAIELVCAGQLPPSFIEYALRDARRRRADPGLRAR